MTPRSKKIIELAADEALQMRQNYIGTEHLLLGMVREGEGIAAGVLESLGVTMLKVRTQTLFVLERMHKEGAEQSDEGDGEDGKRRMWGLHAPRLACPTPRQGDGVPLHPLRRRARRGRQGHTIPRMASASPCTLC